MGGIALLGIIFLLQDAKALQTDKTFLQKVKELDYIGPMLFIPAIIIMLIVLQFGGSTYAWVSVGTFSLIGAFLVLIGIWLYTQYRLGDRATVPFAVLFQRTVFSASWFGYFSLGAFSLMAFYGPYYFQAINGSSALQSGIRALPLILTATVFSVIAGLLISMLGYYTPIMIGGTALLIIATGLLTTLTSTTPYVKIAGLMALAGVGIGMNFQVPSHQS
jgi:MFS family permease